MALKLNVSNSLFQLVDHLAINLRKPMLSVFQPHYIITQTQGMNNWLKVQIADRRGIAANTKFLKPNDIIREVYFLLGGQKQQVLSSDSLQWFLFNLLDDPGFKMKYPDIAAYYDEQDDIKRIALAEKLADLFDQYQIYRPEMIKEWNKRSPTDISGIGWQEALWVEMKSQIGSQMPDKTRIGEFIIDSLKNENQQQRIRELIPRIEFFGISIITAYHLEVFHELGKHIDISFHLLNPSPSLYWFEDRSDIQIARWRSKARKVNQEVELPNEGNPLLTNWGKVIQDTFGLFFKNDEFLNDYEDDGLEPSPVSLLGKIKYDIYHNLFGDERTEIIEADLNDGSIRINSCYTPVREVEVLYNYLVHLVNDSTESLKARDIVVMVSDIDTYAPYIKAVFGSAPYKLPFNIADERVKNEDGILGALEAILDLNEDNFKAESVLQLLEWSYICKRFKLSDKELIRKAVKQANIRFGMEGSLRDDTVYVSWMNGLDRIMYGICLLDEEEYQTAERSFYPVDVAEGEQALELVRFAHFVRVLMEVVKGRSKKRTLVEWGEYVLQLIAQLLFQSEDEEDQDNQLVINYVNRINVVGERVSEKISFDVFKHNFQGSISGEMRTGNFALGGITFCSLIPMRSIPFKVVALLGLGFDQFPRKEIPSNLDLMQRDKRKGDRNTKENDKHLFLETILSAQDRLFISYQGRSTKDNTVIPPSAVVDELIDYILSGGSKAVDNDGWDLKSLVTEHPLHNFTVQPQGFVNYLPIGKSALHERIRQNGGTPEIGEVNELTVRDLIRFFRNPFEHYYNRALNVFYGEEDILLPDIEDFELDKLKQWRIKTDYLLLSDQDLSAYIDKGKKTGQLPLKNMSVALMEALTEGIDPVRDLVHSCIAEGEERSIAIHLDVNGVHISGLVDQVYGDRRISVCFSKNYNKYLLEAYIHHLLLLAVGEALDSYFILAENRQVYILSAHEISRGEALERLSALARCYSDGCESPFVFYPGFENNPVKLSGFDFKKYQKMIGDYFINARSARDPYLVREFHSGFFDQEQIFEAYLRNSSLVFSDAFQAFKI